MIVVAEGCGDTLLKSSGEVDGRTLRPRERTSCNNTLPSFASALRVSRYQVKTLK